MVHLIFRWREMVLTFRTGYVDALNEFWLHPQEDLIHFCGDYFAEPSTVGVLYTGMEGVEFVLEDE